MDCKLDAENFQPGQSGFGALVVPPCLFDAGLEQFETQFSVSENCLSQYSISDVDICDFSQMLPSCEEIFELLSPPPSPFASDLALPSNDIASEDCVDYNAIELCSPTNVFDGNGDLGLLEQFSLVSPQSSSLSKIERFMPAITEQGVYECVTSPATAFMTGDVNIGDFSQADKLLSPPPSPFMCNLILLSDEDNVRVSNTNSIVESLAKESTLLSMNGDLSEVSEIAVLPSTAECATMSVSSEQQNSNQQTQSSPSPYANSNGDLSASDQKELLSSDNWIPEVMETVVISTSNAVLKKNAALLPPACKRSRGSRLSKAERLANKQQSNRESAARYRDKKNRERLEQQQRWASVERENVELREAIRQSSQEEQILLKVLRSVEDLRRQHLSTNSL